VQDASLKVSAGPQKVVKNEENSKRQGTGSEENLGKHQAETKGSKPVEIGVTSRCSRVQGSKRHKQVATSRVSEVKHKK
jgi:hypothetical protein